MPSTLKPFGLSTAGYIGGKPRASSYQFPITSGLNTNLGSGDPVTLNTGTIYAALAAAAYPPVSVSEIIIGVFQSVSYTPAQQNTPPSTFPYWVAGTRTANGEPGMVSVNIDPMQIYNVQANGTMSQSDIGNNYNLGGFQNTGTISPGQSAVYLINVDMGPTTNYGQVKLLGLAPSTPAYQNNSWSDPYPIVQVVLNSTFLKLGTYSIN